MLKMQQKQKVDTSEINLLNSITFSPIYLSITATQGDEKWIFRLHYVRGVTTPGLEVIHKYPLHNSTRDIVQSLI